MSTCSSPFSPLEQSFCYSCIDHLLILSETFLARSLPASLDFGSSNNSIQAILNKLTLPCTSNTVSAKPVIPDARHLKKRLTTSTTGPIVRIAPNRFSLSDPEAIKQIYGHGTKFIKSAFYHTFGSPDPLFYNLFQLTNPERHSRERRKVASLYSMSTLVSYERYVDSCNSVLCEQLQDLARSGELVNVPNWMQFYAFDVIGEITVSN